MSTRRGAYQHRGLTRDQLAVIRPTTGFKRYQCSYCHYPLSSVHDVLPHEASCTHRAFIEEYRAHTRRRFIRRWESHR